MQHRNFILIICAFLTFAGCETLEGGLPGFGALTGINVLTVEQERELGAQVAAEVEAQERVLDDPQVQAYVAGVGQRLAAVVERRDVDYQFKVIDAPDSLNAFALPGGYMYIYTGLLRVMENEAELAGVMGHEIAHVSSHHHGEAMTRAYGVQWLLDALVSRERGRFVQLASSYIAGTGQLYFSREAEREADTRGMNYMVRAGYHPQGMVSFMEKLRAADQRGATPRWMAYLSTHPATEARVAAMNAQMQQLPPESRGQGELHTERYQQEVLNRLR